MLRMLNKTIVRVTTYSADAPWRKHGNYLHEHQERSTRVYDAIAHRQVAPMGGFGSGGLVIRKLRAK